MSYTVLARKWRPKNFSELVGQSHVMQALSNALDQQRLHHAYLFTGTRGVGKTTIARIFSKALNCEEGISSTPCGVCATCRSIDEGRFIDLIEVDAASRTKVDDTREILDNVQFAPTQGRFKVYLIDEVHMLSKSSFNALLKTLEEPPEHVKFLLATTDPHKLPITVLSRCLQFNLMRLTQVQIQTHLEYLMTQEGFPFDANALSLIAKGADGSARDALSLLDQAIAYGAGEVRFEPVQTMLGLVDQQFGAAILSALATNDPTQIKEIIQQLATMGVDYQALLVQLVESLHAISYYQMFGETASPSGLVAEVLAELASLISPERVQLLYQIALLAKQDLQLAPDIRIGFEMSLIRMLAFQPATAADSQQGGGDSQTGMSAVSKPKSATPAASPVMDPKQALSGLASARSLMAKKSSSDIATTEPAKVEAPVAVEEAAPQASVADVKPPAIARPTQSVEPEPIQPSVQESVSQVVQSSVQAPVENSAQSVQPMENQAFAQQMQSEAPPQFDDPYANYAESSGGNAGFDASTPPWDVEEQSNQQGSQYASQPSMMQGAQPNISAPQAEAPAENISSSDHLAQIKARLKQPLGKPRKASPASQPQQVNQTSVQSTSQASSANQLREPVNEQLNALQAKASEALGSTNKQTAPSAPTQVEAPMSRVEQQMKQAADNAVLATDSALASNSEQANGSLQEVEISFVEPSLAESQQPQELAPESEAAPSIEETLSNFRPDDGLIEQWLKVLSELSLKGMATDIARNSALIELTAEKMVLSVDPAQNYSKQEVAFAQLNEAVTQRFGAEFILEFVSSDVHFTPVKYEEQLAADRQSQAVSSIEQDPAVLALSQQLGLEIIASSIKPI